MGLTIFEETFGTSRNRFGKVSKREATVEHLVAITGAVQKVVDTFRDPNTGQRFIVSLSSQTEAYTTPDTKRIVVSYKPIFDKGLKVSTACTVMTGLTLHEIGHTLYTFPNQPAIAAAFGTPGQHEHGYYGRKLWDQLAYTMLNIADDARLEARMVENLPIAAGIFPTMLHWVAVSTGMVGDRLRWRGKAMDMSERVNFAARAIRYPWTATWSSDANTRAERLWWAAWGIEYMALGDRDADDMVRLIRVALDRLRNPADLGDLPQPKQPPLPPGPGGTPGVDNEDDDEDADEDETEPGTKTNDPFGDDFDKDEDGDDEDEDEDADDDESDEDGDGDDDGEDADDDEVEVDADDDEQDDDAPKGDDETEPGDGGDKEGEPDQSGESKVGEADEEKDPKDFPQDFDSHDLKGNVDTINGNPDNWTDRNAGALVQKLLDTDSAIDRVDTGRWGKAKVEVRSIEQLAQRGY